MERLRRRARPAFAPLYGVVGFAVTMIRGDEVDDAAFVGVIAAGVYLASIVLYRWVAPRS